jgi:RNA polymerase sigma-70 factor (family 1)
LHQRDDARDLVQDLFVSLWTNRESLVIRTSLSSYLYTAIKYRVINYIESNIVRGNYLKSLNSAVVDYDNSTTDTIISSDLQQFLDSQIDNLSPRVREVFELTRNENLSIRQVAERLNISDQTVKNQISKALKILRVHIGDLSAIFLILTAFSAS